MKLLSNHLALPLLTVFLIAQTSRSAEYDRSANSVILDKTGVRNLRIETVQVEARTFERTVFAIGRIEEIPSHHYSLSSRIPGRAIVVNAFIGDRVKKGQVLVQVESRQPGNPPPVISLKANHDGIVVSSHVWTGQPVQPDSALLDISDRSELWAVAQIPEHLAKDVHPGSVARISFPAVGGKPVEAKLLRFGVQADRHAGTVDGIFLIPNPEFRLQPGMRAEFSIIIGRRANVLSVPEVSVQGDPAGRVIYVADLELPNVFIRSPVVLGEKGGGWIEIKSGVFLGDDVVTRGSYSLGFVGSGSGISLKEALDAAHGHEHNEDGSEMTSQQKKAKSKGTEDQAHGATEGDVRMMRIYQIYAGVVTLLALILFQLLWNSRRKATAANPS